MTSVNHEIPRGYILKR